MHRACDVVPVEAAPASSRRRDVRPLDASSPAALLAQLFAPLAAADFKRRYFRRKCLARRAPDGGAAAAAFASRWLCSGHRDLAALLEGTASDRIHCWLRSCAPAALSPSSSSSASSSSASAAAEPARLDSVRVETPREALTMYGAGASLYFRAPPDTEAAFVPALAEALGMCSAAYFDASRQAEPRGEIECFATREGHVTRGHTDFMENFTYQVSGRKRWRLRLGDAASPLRGATPHYRTLQRDVVEQQLKTHALASPPQLVAPSASAPVSSAPASLFDGGDEDFYGLGGAGEVCEVELGPGDSLYFPAGCWHRVECVEDGLSINLSLVGQTWADVGASAVRMLLWRDAAWRRIVSVDPDATLLPPAAVVAGAREEGAVTEAGGGAKRRKTASTSPLAAASPSVLSQLETMLASLQASIARLRPEHLLPPCALLSRRFGGVEGGEDGDKDGGEEGESEGDADGDADKEAPLDFSRSARRLVADPGPGIDVRFARSGPCEGQLVLTVRDFSSVATEATARALLAEAAASAAAVPRRLAPNPLAVTLRGAEVDAALRESAAGQPRGAGEGEFIVHVNFGAVSAGGDDDALASLLRTTVRVPAAEAAATWRLATCGSDSSSGSGSGAPVTGTGLASLRRALQRDALERALLFAGALGAA